MMKNVNHPDHYNHKGKECIVEMREKYGYLMTAAFCLMNAYKYDYRCGHKGSPIEDIEKHDWYIKYYEDYLQKPIEEFAEDRKIVSDIKKLYNDLTGGRE